MTSCALLDLRGVQPKAYQEGLPGAHMTRWTLAAGAPAGEIVQGDVINRRMGDLSSAGLHLSDRAISGVHQPRGFAECRKYAKRRPARLQPGAARVFAPTRIYQLARPRRSQ